MFTSATAYATLCGYLMALAASIPSLKGPSPLPVSATQWSKFLRIEVIVNSYPVGSKPCETRE
jgi:hypothetical protein